MRDSDKTRAEALAATLHSTINMFTATYCELTSGTRDRLLDNALMESFALHARNLFYFFLPADLWPAPPKPDDMMASHYTDEGYVPFEPEQQLKDTIETVNRLVSQLNLSSVDASSIGVQERHELFSALIAEVYKFSAFLRPQYKPAWKACLLPILDA
jgi:hypothetical protein